jgi:hypothetical protein
MRALAWKWFLRLSQRGKNPAEFVHSFVCYLARAVKSGRSLVGKSRFNDAMHPASQKRRGFAVEPLALFGAHRPDCLHDALTDNTVTPPPEAASFRIDFPCWFARQTHRNRRIIGDLMIGERPGVVARKFDLSRSRIAQLRRQFNDDWTSYVNEPATTLQQVADVTSAAFSHSCDASSAMFNRESLSMQ